MFPKNGESLRAYVKQQQVTIIHKEHDNQILSQNVAVTLTDA